MPPSTTTPSWFWLDAAATPATLHLSGRWRMADLARIEAALGATSIPAGVTVDATGLEQIDSAAALVLLHRLQPRGADDAARWHGLSERDARVVEQVRGRFTGPALGLSPRHEGFLVALGRYTTELGVLLAGHVHFLGATVAALAAGLLHPRRIRLRELTVQIERTGLTAIPVVALVTSLIGVVVAYLLGLQAERYGANIFVVDGVGIGTTREFAPIIVAVIVAGRSGAAFAAELGAMKLTEEIDAIRTLGLDEWQVLVIPRIIALVVALPLLVFVGDVASLVGAMVVTQPTLGITPAAFLARLQEALEVRHVFIGLVKAPVFAFAIAIVGTRMGMTTARDTRAVGAATTSTVVQSIVAVILLDAAFALILQELDL